MCVLIRNLQDHESRCEPRVVNKKAARFKCSCKHFETVKVSEMWWYMAAQASCALM